MNSTSTINKIVGFIKIEQANLVKIGNARDKNITAVDDTFKSILELTKSMDWVTAKKSIVALREACNKKIDGDFPAGINQVFKLVTANCDYVLDNKTNWKNEPCQIDYRDFPQFTAVKVDKKDVHQFGGIWREYTETKTSALTKMFNTLLKQSNDKETFLVKTLEANGVTIPTYIVEIIEEEKVA